MPILNMAGGGGGGSKLNIFCQPTEPKTKRGIWVQAPQVNLVKEVVFDDTPYPAGTFMKKSPVALSPVRFQCTATCELRGKLYHFFYINESNTPTQYCLCYDPSTNTWTTIDLWAKFDPGVAGGSKIVQNYPAAVKLSESRAFIGMANTASNNRFAYIFDADTNTTYGYSFPNIYSAGTTYYNGCLYTFGGWFDNNYTNTIQKIDLSNITSGFICKNIGNMPFDLQGCYAVTVGDKAYIFLGMGRTSTSYNKRVIIFDYATNTISYGTDSPFTSLNNGYPFQRPVVVGAKVYFLATDVGGGYSNALTETYIYDTITQKWSLGDKGTYGRQGIAPIYYNTKIYVSGGFGYNDPAFGESVNGTGAKNYTSVYALTSKQYVEGQVVIERWNGAANGKYNTALFETITKMLGNAYFPCFFENAWLFKDNNLQELPTYYGNGASWIKFKN